MYDGLIAGVITAVCSLLPENARCSAGMA
jgi:hypothetical protein